MNSTTECKVVLIEEGWASSTVKPKKGKKKEKKKRKEPMGFYKREIQECPKDQ